MDGTYGRPLRDVENPGLFTDHQSLYEAAYNALPNPVTPDLSQALEVDRPGTRERHDRGASIAIEQSLTSDTVSAALQAVGQSIGLKVNVVKLTPAAFGAEATAASARERTTCDQLVEP